MNVHTRISVIMLLLALAGCDQITGPRDYGDCILKSMKDANSDMAARAIVMSCREKFSERKPEDIALPSGALGQLTGHGIGDFGHFSGNIYNGNRDWTVTQITIKLVPKGKEKGNLFLDLDAEFLAKEYNEIVTVLPLTSRSFSFAVDGPKQEYFWEIVGARGHKSGTMG